MIPELVAALLCVALWVVMQSVGWVIGGWVDNRPKRAWAAAQSAIGAHPDDQRWLFEQRGLCGDE